jgi:hypothetical protein
VAFLAQLNGLETSSIDVGNAYLAPYTNGKVYIIAGPEFREMQMQLIDLQTLMITKILTILPIKAFLCGGPNPGLLVSTGVGLTATLTVGHFIDQQLCENHRSPMSISSLMNRSLGKLCFFKVSTIPSRVIPEVCHLPNGSWLCCFRPLAK